MSVPGSVQVVTAEARARYTPLAGTPALRVTVALPTYVPEVGNDVGPQASAQFAAGQSFAVWLVAFNSEVPHPRAGHEIHSRHQRITTSTVDVLAVAESVLDAPRWACRALPGHEDWADEPPVGRWFGRLPGPGEDLSAGGCQAGDLNGWWLHFQAPSHGSLTLSAAVVRRRQDPENEDAVQLGTLSVDITLT